MHTVPASVNVLSGEGPEDGRAWPGDTHTGPGGRHGVWAPRKPAQRRFRLIDAGRAEEVLPSLAHYFRMPSRGWYVDHFLGGNQPGEPPVLWERLWVSMPLQGRRRAISLFAQTCDVGKYAALLA